MTNYASPCDANKTITVIAEGDAPIVGGAGSYTIYQASLVITPNGVHHKNDKGEDVGGLDTIGSIEYSGAVNHYEVTLSDSNVQMTFSYAYKKTATGSYTDILASQVVNVGYYMAHGTLSNDNYQGSGADIPFQITPATITLTAKDSTVEYGTTLNGDPTDDKDGRFTYGGYEYDKGTLLQNIYDSYISTHPVTYKTDNLYTAKSGVGSSHQITPVCANDEKGNVIVNTEQGNLEIVKRNVTVTLYGYFEGNSLAQCDYLGTYAATQAELKRIYEAKWSSFMSVDDMGDSGDTLDKLAVTFTLPNNAIGANAGGYGMRVRSGSDTNYAVTFKTSAGRTAATISDNAPDAPRFVINKAKLTIYAHAVVNDGTPATYTVTYGNDLSFNDRNDTNSINYSVVGMQNGENFRNFINVEPTYSVVCGAKAYAAWESNFGETYTVSVSFNGGLLANYELDSANGTTYVTTTLTINKRVITVSTQDQEFTWDGEDYHDGLYGKAHEAEFKFEDRIYVSDEADANVNGAKRPVGYKVTYNTDLNTDCNQIKGAAPTIVGEYEVKVALAENGNYTFRTGLESTLSFNVTQRIIREGDLTWDPSSIFVKDEEKSGSFTMANYIDDIMEVRMFTYYPSGQSGSTELYYSETAGEPNTYYFDGQVMKIDADGIGRYEVIIQLRESATHNYLFEGSHNALIYSSFAITSTSANLTLTIEDWTYGATPNLPDARINGDINESIIIEYAIVTDDSNINLYYNTKVAETDVANMLDSKGIEGLKVSASWYRNASTMTFNAGYYVVRARYADTISDEDGNTSSVNLVMYYVFKVSKALVDLPVKESKGAYTFNGSEQSLTITYPTTLVRASYNGHTGTADNGIVVYATNARTYTVTFTIIDTKNYEWDDEYGGTNQRTVSWEIVKDTTANGQNDDSILYANEQTEKEYGEELFAISGETVKDGYDSSIVRSYVDATGKDFATISSLADGVWTNGLPENAGEYFVKLVLRGNNNFTDKVTYVKLSVTPKEIEVTASGTVTYGNSLQNRVSYVGTGLYGDVVKGTATFELVENYGTLHAGKEYYVIVAVDENGSTGLIVEDVNGNDVSDNYVLRPVAGRLVVNQRAITVTLGTASSQFGKDVDTTDVGKRVTSGQLATQDSINDLKLSLKVRDENNANVTNTTSVGVYTIDADYTNTDYVITIIQGAYTITQREVTVVINSVKDVVYGDTSVKDPINYSVLDGETDITAFVSANGFTLSVIYNGTANDGTPFNDSTAMPTLAGNYTATVRGAGSDNFIVVGEPFTTFAVSKKEVDGSLITIANQTYTGKVLTPVINNSGFVALYGDVYDELSHEAFVSAGAHTVTLEIKDFNNYKWMSVEIATFDVTFTIDKADNALISNIAIDGWIYGEYSADANLPVATVKFGQESVTFIYSNEIDGEYTSGAPTTGDVGKYWVKVSVPATDNFNAFVSAPVEFAISKKALAQPSLTIVTDGEGKNDVYTGEDLLSMIAGFDMALMNLNYEGKFNVNNGQVVVIAVDAGTYIVKLSLSTPNNYCWQGQDGNDITLSWTIAPKAIAKPTANTDRFMVNGQVLTYIPVGFDEEVMTISGNQTAFGGEFTVTVGLKDKSNYVWIEGGTDDFTLEWNVVGINTVFYIVVGVLSGSSVAVLSFAGVQVLLDRRRKRSIDRAIDERSKKEVGGDKKAAKNSDTNEGGNK